MHLIPEMNTIIALGLCATKEWKRALDLPNLSNESFNIFVQKALHENDIESALNSMNKCYPILSSKTLIAFVKYFDRNPEDIPQHVDKLLSSCELVEQWFLEAATQQFIQLLRRHGHHADINAANYS